MPYIVVVGNQEKNDGTVAPNERGRDEKRPALPLDAFIAELRDRVRQKN